MEKELGIGVASLVSLVDSTKSYFEDKWDKIRRYRRLKKGQDWSPEEKRRIEAQGRQAYSFSIAMKGLNIMSASFRQSKTQWQVKAKSDVNDEVKAELGGMMLRDAERNSKWEYLQSDVFEDGKDLQYGAVEVKVDESEIEPKVIITKLMPENVIWDTNSTTYNKSGKDSDCLFTGKLDYYYRYQIKDKYGDINENEMDWGYDSFFCERDLNGNKDYDVITLATIYLRTMRTYHYVMFDDSQSLFGQGVIVKKYRVKKQAEQELRRLNAAYLMSGLEAEGEVVTRKEEKLDKYVFHYGDIVEYEETDEDESPIKIYFSFQSGAEVWSMMDYLIDPQTFYDRIYSQIDYSMGKDIKSLFEINEGLLAEGEDADSVNRKITMTGEAIRTNAPPGQHAVHQIMGKGINPQWMQVAGIVDNLLDEGTGGNNFQGVQETSGESGKAIQTRIMQGQLTTYYMVSNFSRFKQELGEYTLKQIAKYDTVERQIKVHGGALSQEMMQLLQQNQIEVQQSALNQDEAYVTVNKGNIPFLQDADLELVVTEAQMSKTEKEMKFVQMSELPRYNPVIAQLPTYMKIMLEYDDNIPRRDKQALVAELDAYNQAQQQAEQEQRDTNKAKVLAGLKKESTNAKGA